MPQDRPAYILGWILIERAYQEQALALSRWPSRQRTTEQCAAWSAAHEEHEREGRALPCTPRSCRAHPVCRLLGRGHRLPARPRRRAADRHDELWRDGRARTAGCRRPRDAGVNARQRTPDRRCSRSPRPGRPREWLRRQSHDRCANHPRGGTTGIVGGSIEDATGRPADPIYPLELAKERIRSAAEAARALPFPFMLTARADQYLWGRPD